MLRELEDLYFNHGIRHVVFRDPIFTTRKDRVAEICDGIVAAGMDELEWQCETAVKTLDRALLEKMARAGCKHISLGVESGNDEIAQVVEFKQQAFIANRIAIRERGRLAVWHVGDPKNRKNIT